MSEEINWLDLDSLTPNQKYSLLDVVYDTELQKHYSEINDPRVYILYDLVKQNELINWIKEDQEQNRMSFNR